MISCARWKRAGTISKYFYDSWAILAHLTDPKIRPYFRSGRGVTTWLNLMEVYDALLRDGSSEPKAREHVAAAEPHLIDFSFEDVLDAMSLRHRLRSRGKNFSYVDSIGYYLARKRRLQFLTGDRAFRGLPGVSML
ncbi:MAG TPA: hypothetical protein VIL58_04160 [Thermoplasmata archaeon]